MDAKQLTIAVVGRDGAGKTALVTHLSLELSPPESSVPLHQAVVRQQFAPPPRPRRSTANQPPPLLLRLARSAASVVLRRAVAVFWSLACRRRPTCVAHSLPAPPDSSTSHDTWQLIDAESEGGLFSVAQRYQPDVVLFVTRLDESRAAKADRLVLTDIERAFGSDVWPRTVCVLTHGHSLPPAHLTYDEYLRGRRDALWRALTFIIPPVPRPVQVSVHTEGDEQDEDDHKDEDDAVLTPEPEPQEVPTPLPLLWQPPSLIRLLLKPLLRGGKWTPRRRPTTARREVLRAQPGQNSVEASASALALGVGGDLGLPDDDPEIERLRNMMFDDPPAPEICVVELAELCPKDSSGDKVLPDGVAWMPELLGAIRIAAKSSRNDRGEPQSGVSGGIYEDPDSVAGVGGRIRRMAREGAWAVTAEFIGIYIFVHVLTQWVHFLENLDKKRRAMRKDLICAIDPKELELLTRNDVPEVRLDEQYEKADDYFFGSDSEVPSVPLPSVKQP
jgi:AIG1 family